ncbi:MAG: hypothetical protein QOI62_939 [Solirubrobacteraceae bacterium]|jgi:hypothetical protein|nr:hypothetical protein [Solirubrobacteraceae bacterium]MEA2357679.1 hypothetical protein [Solirubrobacteraceae bacterium]MEA2394051.1 hypothetical protein [Solirubrobacteraceae bacterium]
MDDQQHGPVGDDADDLLRRALIDTQASVAVAMRVGGLAMAGALTIVFHGRADLGTIQTYVAHGGREAGSAIGADELLRVPCDLDLGDAASRDEAEEAYAEQARTLRDALLAADTVLAIWREPLEALAEAPVGVDRSVELQVRLPAHRIMPVALVAPDRHMTIAPVCGARPLAEGRPPMGIACAQQDVARVYPLPDDPERCLEDFAAYAAEHARRMAERLDHQDASVRRFMELSGEEPPQAA